MTVGSSAAERPDWPTQAESPPTFPVWPSLVVTVFLGTAIYIGRSGGACVALLLWWISVPFVIVHLFVAVFPPMRWQRFVCAGLWLVLPSAGMLAGQAVIERQIAETIRSGEVIAKALQDYRDREGHFPKSLEELVPTDLQSLPSTSMFGERRPFRYSRIDDKDDYVLAFDSSATHSKLRKRDDPWHTND